MRLCLILLAALTLEAAHPWVHKIEPVPPAVFPVLAWNPSPTDDESLALMKQAGLNLSGFCEVAELDKVRAAGLACIVKDAAIDRMVSRNQAADAEIRKAVEDLAARIAKHPAAFGVYLRDEPGVELMPVIGRIAAELHRALPDKLPYVNLYPNYANRRQLGAESYDAYLRSYVQLVKLPYLSWDNYSLEDGQMQQRFYDNLEQVRRVTLETGIAFWNCILSNTLFRHMDPSDATFNIQVYATLAYGGRGIEYFTYFNPDVGNFRLAPIDVYGNKTMTWDMLRRINRQIHALAPALSRLRSTGVYHWPVSTAEGTPLVDSLRSTGRFLIGEFVDPEGRPWFMLVNKDLKESVNFTIGLKDKSAKLVRVSAATGTEGEMGGEGNWLAPGAGVLLRVER
jgi:hypothetical protein